MILSSQKLRRATLVSAISAANSATISAALSTVLLRKSIHASTLRDTFTAKEKCLISQNNDLEQRKLLFSLAKAVAAIAVASTLALSLPLSLAVVIVRRYVKMSEHSDMSIRCLADELRKSLICIALQKNVVASRLAIACSNLERICNYSLRLRRSGRNWRNWRNRFDSMPFYSKCRKINHGNNLLSNMRQLGGMASGGQRGKAKAG